MATRVKPAAKKPAVRRATVSRKSVTKKAPAKAVAKKSSLRRASTKRSTASKPKSNKLHHRVHHHVKRHVMRYIGGATALFVLTFAAQTGLSYAATKKSANNPKKGYMIIYSEKGKYTNAVIASSNPTFGCKVDGSTTKSPYGIPFTLNKSGKKIACDVTGGTQRYNISYIGGNNVSVDVDAGYCVLVHNNPAKIRKVQAKGSKCENDSKNDTITQVSSTMTAKLDDPKSGKKNLTGWADIQAKGVTKKMCSGQTNFEVKNAAGQVVQRKRAPVKYTKIDGPARCVAKININKTEYGQSYTIQASFVGNPYLSGSQNSSRVVSIPAKSSSKKNNNNGKKANIDRDGISPSVNQ